MKTWREALPLFLVCAWTLAALMLRVWHIDFGLPHVFYLDEAFFTYIPLNMGGGDLNPHFFAHPTMFFYLCFLVDAAYILWGLLAGVFHELGDAWVLYQTNPTVFYSFHRTICAILGTATVPLVYLAGKRLSGKQTGVLSALFLSFAFLHVQYSRVMMLDVPLTFFTTLCFLAAFRAADEGETKYFLLAGLAGGMSASIKYQGLEMFMLGILAAQVYAVKMGRNPWTALWGRENLFFSFFFLLGFTIGTPFWILDFENFAAAFLRVWSCYKSTGSGQLGYEGNYNWEYYLFQSLGIGMGAPLLFCAAAGMVLLLYKPNLRGLFFLSFPLVYFLIAGSSSIRTSRYIIPVVPFACIAAAYFLSWTTGKIFRQKKTAAWIACMAIGMMVVWPSMLHSLQFDRLSASSDTRVRADRWVQDHVQHQEKILISSNVYLFESAKSHKLVQLDKTVFDTRVHNLSSLGSLAGYRVAGFDYVLLDDWHTQVILAGRTRESSQFEQTIKRYKAFLREIEASAQLVVEFSPYARSGTHLDLYNLDLPSSGLSGLKSFGPLIKVYKLNS